MSAFLTFSCLPGERICDQKALELEAQAIVWLAENGDEETKNDMRGARDLQKLAKSKAGRAAASCGWSSLGEESWGELPSPEREEIEAWRRATFSRDFEALLDVAREGTASLAVRLAATQRTAQLRLRAIEMSGAQPTETDILAALTRKK